MGNLNFDANQVEPESGGFDPMPAGEYSVIVTESSIEDTKAGDGQYLKLELLVIAGPFENRRLFANLNIANPSATAQKIGQGQLSALCRAVGKLQVSDSAELHNIPFIAKVAVKNDQQYGPQNVVKAFKAAQGAQGHQQAQAAPQQAAQPAAAASGGGGNAGKRPWER